MYWADLSRLGTGIASIFSEIYQLLFHLTSVGINNISAAAFHLRDDPKRQADLRRWTWLRWIYLATSAIFAWPIAILNLFLVGFLPAILAISLVRTYVSADHAFLLVLGLYTGAAGTAIAAAVLRYYKRLKFPGFALAFLLPLAVATEVWQRTDGRVNPEQTEGLLGIFILAASAVPIWFALVAYDRRRPGSLRASLILTVLYIGVALYFVPQLSFWRAPVLKALVAIVNLVELTVHVLGWSWVAFAVLYLLTLIACFYVTLLSPKEERRFAARTVWTAVLALVLPSLLFLVITLAGWTGILKVVTPLLPLDPPAACYSINAPYTRDICYEPLFSMEEDQCRPRRFSFANRPQSLRAWADRQMDAAGMAILPVVLGSILVSMILAVWSFGPSVLDEIDPHLVFHQNAGIIGEWLSSGFRFLYPAGLLLVAAMTYCMVHPLLPCWVQNFFKIRSATKLIGTMVAGAGAGLLGFRGRLSQLALGFRPVVRVMLDVDNWLREHPRDSNPTGLICARYVSLLRHICNYRDPDGFKHDALVIVAHSQGTVITADLLRFLKVEHQTSSPPEKYDPGLQRMLSGELPVYLLTMGCPLRQLYGLRFPYLYSWARHERGDTFRVDTIPGNTSPDPAELGVVDWVNAFRSADYVGRHIWRRDDYPATASPSESTDNRCTRREICIGAGAHTHYWDGTAQEIAEILDDIVSRV
jgi:hypothetical protein